MELRYKIKEVVTFKCSDPFSNELRNAHHAVCFLVLVIYCYEM